MKLHVLIFSATLALCGAQVAVTTLAGNGTGAFSDGAGVGAAFWEPEGVAVDSGGNVFIADHRSHRIRKITPGGVVSTLAGSGAGAFADGGTPSFNYPKDVAVEASGAVLVADGINNRVRRVTPGGVVSTLAGNGTSAFADGTGVEAAFWYPAGLAVDSGGVLFVADRGNHRIRRVAPGGVVSTLAGSGAGAFADGAGTAASFHSPSGLAVDVGGNLCVCVRPKPRRANAHPNSQP
jgi:serine/threonine-protein kinase